MGLFDEVLGAVEAQSGQHAALYEEIATLVTQSGGVNGLLQKFEQQGLGGLASSWKGGAGNTPLTAEQIIQVVGQDKVTQIASKVGLTEQQVSDGISKILPVIIAHLTPGGTAAPSNLGAELETEAMGLLKAKLFGS